MKKLTTKMKIFKNRLTSVSSKEPLNKLSMAVIIILDLFVLTLVFNGLDEHTQQLTTANEYMPATAHSIFIDQNWTSANRISRLQPIILSDRNNARYRYKSPFDDRQIKLMHPAARRFFEQAEALSKDRSLLDLFLSRQKTVEERTRTEKTFDKAKKSYDTQLLENIANAAKPDSNMTATTARQYAQEIDQLIGEIRNAEQKINAHAGVQEIWKTVSPDNALRDKIVSDYKRFQFWFPLKELLWQLVFLLPIFAIFFWWSSRSVKKEKPIQTLIASHLLVIVSLPIILKVIELVIDIIPKHFFKKLFAILQSLHLIALWSYFVIFSAIAIGLFLIVFIQRKVFNKQKVMQKRLAKGTCIVCNKQLPSDAKICPFCGVKQMVDCTTCKKETPLAGTYCIHCGANR
jgi:preprotein translocase subunit YajC